MMVAVSLEFAAFPAVFPETSLVVALTTIGFANEINGVRRTRSHRHRHAARDRLGARLQRDRLSYDEAIRIILRNEGGRDPCIAGIRCILVGEQKVVGPEFDHDPRVRLRGPQGINETRCCAGP